MNENSLTLERTPDVIALEIKTLSNQFKSLALSYAIEIGRKLVEAKTLVNHGEWGGWLKDQTEFSQSTANNLMRIFTEYGADQVGIFGDSNSQTLGNLSYTKALKLLDIPPEEREEFAIAHNAEELSTRQIEALIKERDEAKKRAAEAEQAEEGAAIKLADLEEELEKAKEQKDDLDDVVKRLKDELKEIQSKPIDVAVMEADPAMIETAKAEAAAAAKKQAEEDLKAKIQKAQDKKKKAEDKLTELKINHDTEVKKLKEDLEKIKAGKSEQNTQELEALKTERDAALTKAADAEKKLAVADPSLTQFKVLYEEAQGMLNKLVGMLLKAEPEKQEGLRKALDAMFTTYGERVKGEKA